MDRTTKIKAKASAIKRMIESPYINVNKDLKTFISHYLESNDMNEDVLDVLEEGIIMGSLNWKD